MRYGILKNDRFIIKTSNGWHCSARSVQERQVSVNSFFFFGDIFAEPAGSLGLHQKLHITVQNCMTAQNPVGAISDELVLVYVRFSTGVVLQLTSAKNFNII